jgi:hypothetical protein
MNQTIRDYIKRRVRWLFAVGILGWLILPASQLLWPAEKSALPLAAVGMIVFFGAILALNYFVKCPRCRANLGRTIAMPLALSFGSGPKINFCPYCGVSLDEPVTYGAARDVSQNPIK